LELQIPFEKLNDLEFKNTIQVHDLVWQSGVPNYLGCRIPVHSNINVEFEILEHKKVILLVGSTLFL
jgi:hypothetical protein